MTKVDFIKGAVVGAAVGAAVTMAVAPRKPSGKKVLAKTVKTMENVIDGVADTLGLS